MSEPFRNYLLRLRRNRRYSQKQFATLLGLRSDKAISKYENGARLPQLKTAMLMEIVLGAKLSEIYVDLYGELGEQAVAREDRLIGQFSRHIRCRVARKGGNVNSQYGGTQPYLLPPQESPSVRCV